MRGWRYGVQKAPERPTSLSKWKDEIRGTAEGYH